MSIKGYDVSSYQSSTYSTKDVDFVIVKATEGTSYINPKMTAQAAHARRHGLVVGFYHFLRPGDMRTQARYFVEQCTSRHGDPLWADWEDPRVSCADKDRFLAEVKLLRGSTHKVGLYCNTDYWLNRDTTSNAGDALWIAQYNGQPGKPSIRHPWLIHQYTNKPIDTNIARFASRSALRAWATGTTETEDTMPSREEIARAVLETDGIVDAPWATNDNTTWQLKSVITHIGEQVHAARTQLAAQDATIDKLADAVGQVGSFDPEALKQEIREAIESVTVRLQTETADA
ncbi:glycoside hydrolase family 25 protein [Streptomyces boncukensis]|uniref:Hydrolase n=1 Tax=Streptomyces boncukensis TaxID=2711219 RepID=A0A6G4WXK7_9ACTN|nr:glycoside hydrolase family 25 protein [Streptomyces boncukensis]NGO69347.1 hypothetical protein [Streptomyces boncukensis]